MTTQDRELIRRAIALLQKLAPVDEPLAVDLPTRRDPIMRFVQHYLLPNADSDVSCAELWEFYHEITASGELPLKRKAIFLRQLPVVMEEVFNARKSHGIIRTGHRVRGFRGVGIRMDTGLPTVIETQIEAE